MQVTAIHYCIERDDERDLERRNDEMKQAWVASGAVEMPPISFDALFPGVIGEAPVDDEDFDGELEEGDILIFEEQPSLSQEEIEAELRELMMGTDITASGGDLYGAEE